MDGQIYAFKDFTRNAKPCRGTSDIGQGQYITLGRSDQ